MVAIQNQLKQMLLNTQMSMLNNTYKTSNNQGIKNAAVSQLSNTVSQAETLQQPTQTAQATPTATAGNVNTGNATGDAAKDIARGDKTKGRSKADFERDVKIIADLKAEFGNGSKMSHDKHWIDAARKSDKINILDKTGTKNIENTSLGGKVGSSDKTIGKGNILEVQSQKYGTVRISVGGDGVMNGRDDVILSIGGKAAANSAQAGLGKALEAPAKTEATPATQTAQATPAAAQQTTISPLALSSPVLQESKEIIANHKNEEQGVDISKIAEAKNLAGSGEVQKLAGKNDEVAGLVGKSDNAYSMDKDQINNLIAALMLIISGQGNFK